MVNSPLPCPPFGLSYTPVLCSPSVALLRVVEKNKVQCTVYSVTPYLYNAVHHLHVQDLNYSADLGSEI